VKKIYLAGPLFSLAEREFNILFAQMIESGMKNVEVILPQERAAKFLSLENGMKLIFKDCLKMVDEADIVVAVLDGPDAYSVKTPIIGVRTDFRISEDRGLNLMLSNICSTLIIDISSDMAGLVDSVIKAISENL